MRTGNWDKEERRGNFAGLDVNVDRMYLAIVDRDENLLDAKTFWFKYARMRPINGKMVWSDIGEKMLKYAYHHEVKVLTIENADALGKLARNYLAKEGGEEGEGLEFRSGLLQVPVLGKIMLKPLSTGL